MSFQIKVYVTFDVPDDDFEEDDYGNAEDDAIDALYALADEKGWAIADMELK